MKAWLVKVENGDTLEALRGLLRRLLEGKVVDALLVPKALPSGAGFVQALVKDPELLKDVHPLAPTMPVQSARILSNLTVGEPEERIGAVIKPCELRAVIELAKFLQVKPAHLVTIAVDCLGTYEVKDYAERVETGDGAALMEGLLRGAQTGQPELPAGVDLRLACRMCENAAPLHADMTLGLFGHDVSQEIEVIVIDRLEAEMKDKVALELSGDESGGRREVISRLAQNRTKKRDEVFGEFRERTKDLQALMNAFSTCIRCHNCMVACPICYCKECVFRTPTFEHQSDQFLRWAGRRGVIQMPADTLIFHLTRLAHMATSCIGCGLCDSACPSGLPVATLFRTVGHGVQSMFDYVPGRDPNETPPVVTFREDELKIVSGGKD